MSTKQILLSIFLLYTLVFWSALCQPPDEGTEPWICFWEHLMPWGSCYMNTFSPCDAVFVPEQTRGVALAEWVALKQYVLAVSCLIWQLLRYTHAFPGLPYFSFWTWFCFHCATFSTTQIHLHTTDPSVLTAGISLLFFQPCVWLKATWYFLSASMQHQIVLISTLHNSKSSIFNNTAVHTELCSCPCKT